MNLPDQDNSSNQDKENAGLDYFSFLYGSKDEVGQPQQTKFDKFRDQILLKLYQKYSNVPIEKSKVLDVGCGYGWLLRNFASAEFCAGVDIAHHAVEIAKIQNPSFHFKQGNLELPIPFDQKFDLVLAINVIEHLNNPIAGVDSISKVCQSGSIVIIHLPTIANRLTRWEYAKLYDSDPTHIYRPSGSQVRQLFEKHGFRCLRDSYLPHIPAGLSKLYPLHPAYLAVFIKT